jgi:hypothetical protein
VHLLAAIALLAAPAAPALNTAEACDGLWDQTVAAAAPDLDPSDDLRKGYLLREKTVLVEKCRGARAEVLSCPPQATQICGKRFPQPPDGGRALGLATCVYPEVQRCVQEGFLSASTGPVGALLADLEAGKVAPDKGGLVKLTGERLLLSARGEALAEKHGKGWWVLLLTRRQGARLEGLVFATPSADKLPGQGSLVLASVKLDIARPVGAALSVHTPDPAP